MVKEINTNDSMGQSKSLDAAIAAISMNPAISDGLESKSNLHIGAHSSYYSHNVITTQIRIFSHELDK